MRKSVYLKIWPQFGSQRYTRRPSIKIYQKASPTNHNPHVCTYTLLHFLGFISSSFLKPSNLEPHSRSST